MSELQMVPMTPEGFEALKTELHELKTVERPQVINEIAEARAHGDLKENAEYHAAREKQSFIEGRITILDDSIARANVIDFSSGGESVIKFGAYVSYEDIDSGEVKSIRIVGDLEADMGKSLVSIGSPIAKAFLGKKADEEITVRLPKGSKEYLIVSIDYR